MVGNSQQPAEIKTSFLLWKPSDVVLWLAKNGMGEYSSKFLEEEVSGRSLLGLTPALIAALIPKIGRQAEFNFILGQLTGDHASLAGTVGGAQYCNIRLDRSHLAASGESSALTINDYQSPHVHSTDSRDSARIDDDPTPHVVTNQTPSASGQPANHNTATLTPSNHLSPCPSTLCNTADPSVDDFVSFLFTDLPSELVHQLDTADRTNSYCYHQSRNAERNTIIRSLYDQLMRVTLYPTSHQYRKAAYALVTRFPVLRDDSKTGFDNWAKSIKDRFKNKRRYMGDIPEVQERRQSRHRQFEQRRDDEFSRLYDLPAQKIRCLESIDLDEDVKPSVIHHLLSEQTETNDL